MNFPSWILLVTAEYGGALLRVCYMLYTTVTTTGCWSVIVQGLHKFFAYLITDLNDFQLFFFAAGHKGLLNLTTKNGVALSIKDIHSSLFLCTSWIYIFFSSFSFHHNFLLTLRYKILFSSFPPPLVQSLGTSFSHGLGQQKRWKLANTHSHCFRDGLSYIRGRQKSWLMGKSTCSTWAPHDRRVQPVDMQKSFQIRHSPSPFQTWTWTLNPKPCLYRKEKNSSFIAFLENANDKYDMTPSMDEFRCRKIVMISVTPRIVLLHLEARVMNKGVCSLSSCFFNLIETFEAI